MFTTIISVSNKYTITIVDYYSRTDAVKHSFYNQVDLSPITYFMLYALLIYMYGAIISTFGSELKP